MKFERKRYRPPYVNIAPLVDIVFLLLLFFMLSSHLVREPSIRLRLPVSRTATPDARDIPVIDITGDGVVAFGGKAMPIEDLVALLAGEPGEGKQVRIRAAREVGVGILVRVMDELRSVGIHQIGLVAERPEPTP